MKKSVIKVLLVFIIICLLLPYQLANAQTNPALGPVYIVEEGDTLWDIAYRFHVSQDALANANGITDTSQLSIGQQLIIPGLEGIQGILTAQNVQYGESIQSLSIRYNIPSQQLSKLNHLTSPNELYAGYSLVIPQNNAADSSGARLIMGQGQSLLELAILNNSDPWSILAKNDLDTSMKTIPGEVLYAPGKDDSGPGGLPNSIAAVDISHLVQGETAEIKIDSSTDLTITGTLMDHTLNFYQDEANIYSSLQGIHAMAKPGLYPLEISGKMPDGAAFAFSQPVYVAAGDFLYDVPLSVDPETMDPKITGPENDLWMELSSHATPDKLWSGTLAYPVEPAFTQCYPSRFGSRRSYNGSDYIYFHTGLDFCGQVGDPIYAAAAGVVVFAGLLTVRGNATMIDHGWGVYTAYMHQSEMYVNVGDHVEQGELIGRVGNTGRVEGPHLHFEVLVGDVQVNPLDWFSQEYP